MIRPLRALLFAAAILLTGLAVESQAALPPGWSFEGCWSRYPNCAGARDIYRDASGALWQCSACGTTTNPGPTTCAKSGDLYAFGYWCS